MDVSCEVCNNIYLFLFLVFILVICLTWLHSVVNYGLRSGGGIGDLLSSMQWTDKDRGWRIFYEISFFFLVIVILLNIIFGIIIDTFGGIQFSPFVLQLVNASHRAPCTKQSY